MFGKRPLRLVSEPSQPPQRGVTLQPMLTRFERLQREWHLPGHALRLAAALQDFRQLWRDWRETRCSEPASGLLQETLQEASALLSQALDDCEAAPSAESLARLVLAIRDLDHLARGSKAAA